MLITENMGVHKISNYGIVIFGVGTSFTCFCGKKPILSKKNQFSFI